MLRRGWAGRLIGAIATIGLLGMPGIADAGGPGTWTQVTGIGVNGANTDEIGLARTADGVLHVAWTRDPNGVDNGDLLHSAIGADGTTVSAPDTILPGVDLNNSVDLLPGPGGGLRVFFAGLMDPPSNPLSGLLATATAAADGKTWAIQPTPVSDPTDLGKHPVYAASGIGGGLFADGTPIGAWGDSAPAGGGYHVGLSSATPDFEFPEAAGDLGPDAATGTDGQLVLARNDIASEPSRLVATLLPSGQELVAPDSEAIQFNDRVSISARSGGQPGIYLGYTSGENPFDGFPTIWKVGDATATRVSNKRGGESTKLSPALDGAFWMMWMRDGFAYASRSNPELTAWGEPVKLKPPSGTTTLYDVTGDGSGGPLDVLVNVDRGGELGYWHQRILPGLSIKAKPKKVNADTGAKVKFKVADAGAPIAGATVEFRGASKTTKANGKAKFKVPAGAKPGKKKATATKSGYSAAKTKVKIKK